MGSAGFCPVHRFTHFILFYLNSGKQLYALHDTLCTLPKAEMRDRG